MGEQRQGRSTCDRAARRHPVWAFVHPEPTAVRRPVARGPLRVAAFDVGLLRTFARAWRRTKDRAVTGSPAGTDLFLPDADAIELGERIADRLLRAPYDVVVLQGLFHPDARGALVSRLRDLALPDGVRYPFVRGGFGPEERTPPGKPQPTPWEVAPDRGPFGRLDGDALRALRALLDDSGLLVLSRLPLVAFELGGRTTDWAFTRYDAVAGVDALCPTGAAAVVVEHPGLRRRMVVACSHLQAGDEHADVRRLQAEQLAWLSRGVGQAAGTEDVLVLGDGRVIAGRLTGDRVRSPRHLAVQHRMRALDLLDGEVAPRSPIGLGPVDLPAPRGHVMLSDHVGVSAIVGRGGEHSGPGSALPCTPPDDPGDPSPTASAAFDDVPHGELRWLALDPGAYRIAPQGPGAGALIDLQVFDPADLSIPLADATPPDDADPSARAGGVRFPAVDHPLLVRLHGLHPDVRSLRAVVHRIVGATADDPVPLRPGTPTAPSPWPTPDQGGGTDRARWFELLPGAEGAGAVHCAVRDAAGAPLPARIEVVPGARRDAEAVRGLPEGRRLVRITPDPSVAGVPAVVELRSARPQSSAEPALTAGRPPRP